MTDPQTALPALLRRGARLLSGPPSPREDAAFFQTFDRLLYETLFERERLLQAPGERNALEAARLGRVLRRYKGYREWLRRKLRPLAEQVSRFYTGAAPERLIVLVTRRCQLRCTYCGIPDYSRDLPPAKLDRAVDFLLTSSRPRLQLQFFGGEPLLNFPLVRRGVERASALAARLGKEVSFLLTTNGLLLTPDKLAFLRERRFVVEVSCDGAMETQLRHRRLGGKDYFPRLLENLEAARLSGCDYYLIMTVLPETVDRLYENFRYLSGLGHRKIQVNYAVGVRWTRERIEAFLGQLDCILDHARANPGVELVNATSRRREPVVLNGELTVDRDGSLFLEPGIFLDLREELSMSSARGATMDNRGATPFDSFWLLSQAYAKRRPELRAVLLNNIRLGLVTDKWIKRRLAVR